MAMAQEAVGVAFPVIVFPCLTSHLQTQKTKNKTLKTLKNPKNTLELHANPQKPKP